MEILSQAEAGIHADVVEDGTTFEENALIKATEIAEAARKDSRNIRMRWCLPMTPGWRSTT